MEDASSAVLDFQLHRLHSTYSMIDFETFREDYRYVYQNTGTAPHSVLPLLWRDRAVQANMYVLDAENNNLVYLPSEMNRDAAVSTLIRLFQAGAASAAGQGQQLPIASAVPTPAEIQAALAFESTQTSRETAFNKAVALSRASPNVSEFAKAAVLLQFALEYYLPLALLPKPVNPGQLCFLRHGVDLYHRLEPQGPPSSYTPLGTRLGRALANVLLSFILRETRRWKLARLFLGGHYDFEVPLALDAVEASGARSFHLRVAIPEGLRVTPSNQLRPTEVFGGMDLLRFASFDESNVYLYLGNREIGSVLRRRDAIKADRERKLAQAKAQANVQPERVASLQKRFARPTAIKWLLDFLLGFRGALLDWMDTQSKVTMIFNVPLYFARGIRPLILFLWVPTAIIVGACLYRAATLDFFVATLSVLFVVVLTIGIFAIDKRVLRGLVLAHAELALAVSLLAYLVLTVF